MRLTAPITLLLLLFSSAHMAVAEEKSCLDCHDFDPASPAHTMPNTYHKKIMKKCERCHGPSADHKVRPTMVAPDISFGPRWTTTVAAQDDTCLSCHGKKVARNWQDALHMANNFTCVTCHDLHTAEDPIAKSGGQAEVCTVCHKTQKEGIHALHGQLDKNPDCTDCHDPHADQRPVGVMLTNDSAGCRTCHDLTAMSNDPGIAARASSYHRAMDPQELTCADCHQGVAHGPTSAMEPFIALPVANRRVTLFNPGQSDIDWVLSEHPGSQPFRQGSNCQQCHRGEEEKMGKALATELPGSRDIDLSFREDGDALEINLSWPGDKDDTSIAFMWGDRTNEAFRRGGCWAACHDDMPGMTRERGQDIRKYLSISRSQQQRIGQPALVKDSASLDALIEAGNFVELWKIDLDQGETKIAQLLSTLNWHEDAGIDSEAKFADGRWTVVLKRPLLSGVGYKAITPGVKYTFGVALHGGGRTGAGHWVSLPMTFSLDGDNTDFMAE
jgi:predicted CXXCH cytochrome family protein